MGLRVVVVILMLSLLAHEKPARLFKVFFLYFFAKSHVENYKYFIIFKYVFSARLSMRRLFFGLENNMLLAFVCFSLLLSNLTWELEKVMKVDEK